ncbi:uncharacterized protein LY89DRAFT_743715 [Mollisia scopiformis]|uniref:MutL C-terminal dimerisation domain-containing protein n=1 Tax=Mollisia scopiformis TaxID=149040 RepID=A0A132B2E9_MOLSC|nr:uncharacterized protein LY89DRAFT_743715 [Mollisia scopiformis]KUJ06570.1 hypothetical protein LY89DRAFT_743715 [Mollisia scopiformis]
MSIQPLPPEVIAQIKSSITITSLNGVICELVKNSLDASSSRIDISVDYTRGGCVVEDDGLGIQPSEFGEDGCLGKLYHSSKLNSQTIVHGGRGTFLASLSAMALMSITSHYHLHRSHNTISMHKSNVVSRQTPAPPQHYLSNSNHGTRVTIRDLFGNMPVRVKQRAIAAEKQRRNHKDWEELRRAIVLLLISWPRNVAITVRELDSNQKLAIRPSVHFNEGITGVDASRVCSILTQATFVSLDEKTSWVPVGISTQSLVVQGTISLVPSAIKQVQFISFGVHPLSGEGPSILHDEINRLFFNSSFGNEEEVSDLDDAERTRRAKDRRFNSDGYTNKELKGGKKGVDRWPMFYINIGQVSSAGTGEMNPDGIFDDTGNKFGAIMELLQVMITKFLTVHHFRPKPSRGLRSRKHNEGDFPQPAFPNGSLAETKISASLNRVAAQAKKSAESRSGKSRLDPLGTNVRLPPFRRSLSKQDSPFEGWSKVKSGAVIVDLSEKEKREETIARPSSAPPLIRGTTTERSQTPLIAKDGKLLRQPFDDVVTARARTTKVIRGPTPASQTIQTTSHDGDEFVAWVNPITKVRCLVNQRTGMTLPAKNERHGRISTKPSFSSQSNRNSTEPSNAWISDILQGWENPVFSTVEPTIPQILLEGPDEHTQSILHGRHHHCSQIDIDLAFKESSAGVSGRISKSALRNAEVVSQVDRKFILVKVRALFAQSCDDKNSDGILILIDQHAADERIRIESLMEQLCTPSKDDCVAPESPVVTTLLNKPLVFEISMREVQVLNSKISYFAYWGIRYEVALNLRGSDTIDAKAMPRLSVRSLPPGIIERCKQEPRLLIELIRTEAWKAHELGKNAPDVSAGQQTWLQRTQTCPQGILDMLNSRACRGAIMFNDELSKTQCEKLVRKLADCKFPFQCAHGRPSLVPLVDTSTMKKAEHRVAVILGEEENGSFGHAFREWKQKSQSYGCLRRRRASSGGTI